MRLSPFTVSSRHSVVRMSLNLLATHAAGYTRIAQPSSLEMRGQNMTRSNQHSGKPGWLTSFLKELVSMPRRHMIVFFITAVLLVLLEVELTEGWHVVHILEILAALVFFYLLWTAWRTGRSGDSNDSPSPGK